MTAGPAKRTKRGSRVTLRRPPPGSAWTPDGTSWRCPACGKSFFQRGLWHSCGVVPLEHHFRDRPPHVRELFDSYRAAVQRVGGPFRLSIARTRIGFIRRITFAGAIVRNAYLRAGFLLLRKLDSPRFVRIEHFHPYWVHTLVIREESDIDAELRRWLKEAYAAGAGLTRPRVPPGNAAP